MQQSHETVNHNYSYLFLGLKLNIKTCCRVLCAFEKLRSSNIYVP